MPLPPAPPTIDAGAKTCPRQLNRWLDVNLVYRLTRTRGYLTLPAFNVTQPHGTGYANLVAVFNCVSPRNLTLTTLGATQGDYALFVAWADATGEMHRYQLNPGNGQIFYFPVVDYTNQIILKNFRFEIWSGDYVLTPYANPIVTEDGLGFLTTEDGKRITTEGYYAPQDSPAQPQIQLVDIQFYTSVLGQYDYYWQDDFLLCSAVGPVTDFYFLLTNPLTPGADSCPVQNVLTFSIN